MTEKGIIAAGFAGITDDHEVNRAVVQAWNEAVEEFRTTEGFAVVRSTVARAILNERHACSRIAMTELVKRDLGATGEAVANAIDRRE